MLGDGPERAGRVSRLLELSKPAVTDAVDGLVERGLAVRRLDESDRRAVAVTITDTGCDVLAAIEERLATALDEIIEHCDDPHRARVALDDLAGAVDRFVRQRRAARGRR